MLLEAKNEVTELISDFYSASGSSQRIGPVSRTEVGEPILHYFYGRNVLRYFPKRC